MGIKGESKLEGWGWGGVGVGWGGFLKRGSGYCVTWGVR